MEDVGIDVNGCPYPGLSALFIACKYQHSPAVVHELLRLGARVNQQMNGRLPIDVLLDSQGAEVGRIKLLCDYRPHPKSGEGNVFTGVCLLIRGRGTPYLLVSCPFRGGGQYP